MSIAPVFKTAGGGDNFAERNILGARGGTRSGFVRGETFRFPQLKSFAAADKRDFVRDADGGSEVLRQRDPPFAVERHLHRSAEDRGFDHLVNVGWKILLFEALAEEFEMRDGAAIQRFMLQ